MSTRMGTSAVVVYSMYKKGDRTQPCGEPVEEHNLSDIEPLTLTHWDLSTRKSKIHPTVPGLKLESDNSLLAKM